MNGNYHYFTVTAASDCHNEDSDDEAICIYFNDGPEQYLLRVNQQWHHLDHISVRQNQDALYTWLEALNLRQGLRDVGVLFKTEMEKIFDAFLRIKLAEALKAEVSLPNNTLKQQIHCAQQELKEVSDPRKLYLAKLP